MSPDEDAALCRALHDLTGGHSGEGRRIPGARVSWHATHRDATLDAWGRRDHVRVVTVERADGGADRFTVADHADALMLVIYVTGLLATTPPRGTQAQSGEGVHLIPDESNAFTLPHAMELSAPIIKVPLPHRDAAHRRRRQAQAAHPAAVG